MGIIQYMAKATKKVVKRVTTKKVLPRNVSKCGACFGTGLESNNAHCHACKGTGVI